MDTTEIFQTLLENWTEEVRATAAYSLLARREFRPGRRAIFEELAQTEKSHGAQWLPNSRLLAAACPV